MEAGGQKPRLIEEMSGGSLASQLRAAGVESACLCLVGDEAHCFGFLALFRRREMGPEKEEYLRQAGLMARVLTASLRRLQGEQEVRELAGQVRSLHRAAAIPPEERCRELDDRMVYHEACFELECRFDLVPLLADHFVSLASRHVAGERREGLKLGLVELMNNAIEHGNLAITSAQKWAAIMSPGGYDVLVAERMEVPELAQRRVFIQFRATRQFLEWVVRDEGAGFDWRASMAAALSPPSPLNPSGRGLFLCRHCFDSIEFNDTGNQVRVQVLIGGFPDDFEPHHGAHI